MRTEPRKLKAVEPSSLLLQAIRTLLNYGKTSSSGDTVATEHPNQEGVDIQHNPPAGIDTPIEHQLPKAKTPEPVKDAYVPSPGLPAGVVSTHDRDSVQPGGTPRPIYAPPAKLQADADRESRENR